jgi:hypothetical protein
LAALAEVLISRKRVGVMTLHIEIFELLKMAKNGRQHCEIVLTEGFASTCEHIALPDPDLIDPHAEYGQKRSTDSFAHTPGPRSFGYFSL